MRDDEYKYKGKIYGLNNKNRESSPKIYEKTPTKIDTSGLKRFQMERRQREQERFELQKQRYEQQIRRQEEKDNLYKLELEQRQLKRQLDIEQEEDRKRSLKQQLQLNKLHIRQSKMQVKAFRPQQYHIPSSNIMNKLQKLDKAMHRLERFNEKSFNVDHYFKGMEFDEFKEPKMRFDFDDVNFYKKNKKNKRYRNYKKYKKYGGKKMAYRRRYRKYRKRRR